MKWPEMAFWDVFETFYIYKKTPYNTLYYKEFILWALRDLNPGPMDYESFNLSTRIYIMYAICTLYFSVSASWTSYSYYLVSIKNIKYTSPKIQDGNGHFSRTKAFRFQI